MKSELKRALLKKSNIILIVAVVSLMLINAYYNGWETALKVDSAQDIRNIEDKIFYKKYFGNMYRVWADSYYMVQALAPVILVAPYLNTYLLEKKNRFRFFCVSRKGNLKYAIVLPEHKNKTPNRLPGHKYSTCLYGQDFIKHFQYHDCNYIAASSGYVLRLASISAPNTRRPLALTRYLLECGIFRISPCARSFASSLLMHPRFFAVSGSSL